MIYPRKLKSRLLRELENDLIVVITGMRRVGKTYLLHDIFNGIDSTNKLFLDLEKIEYRQIFKEESYEAIFRDLVNEGLNLPPKIPGETSISNNGWLFIDEIQFVPQIPSVLKYLTDHYQLKCVVSGSSSFYLKNLFSESLSGRKVIFELTPLDFGEFLIFQGESPKWVKNLTDLTVLDTVFLRTKYAALFTNYLETGGFPQAVLFKDASDRQRLLLDILNSYLTIDVRTLSDFKGINELEKLIRLIPPRIGQKLDISRLSRELGIARSTCKNYLDFLKDTFVVDFVTPFTKSPDREISVTPKIYFCDIGLGSVLSPVSEGQRLENYVESSLSRQNSLKYYQRKSGPEIDFVVDKRFGVEVKVFATERDYQKLSKLSRELGLEASYVFSQRLTEEKIAGILPAFLLGFLE